MIFYKINTDFLPRIEFAFSCSSDHFSNVIHCRNNLMEIIFNTGDTIYCTSEKGEFEIPCDSLFVIMPDMSIHLRCNPGEHLSTQNVAMYLENFQYDRFEMNEDDPNLTDLLLSSDPQSCFIPILYDASKQREYVSAVFNLIINGHMRNTGSGVFVSLGNWYSLFPLINENFTAKFLNKKMGNVSTYHYYGVKVKKIIEGNFHTHIRVSDIAARLKLSPNYLSSIFKKEHGITILEYTNQLRVQEARRLMQTSNYTITEIAHQVGLNDTRYLQRLFKKHYGLCMRDCAMIDNEITLFHQKPWEDDPPEIDTYQVKHTATHLLSSDEGDGNADNSTPLND